MDKILSNPNWSFVEVYADEGISGTQAAKRDNFLRMILLFIPSNIYIKIILICDIIFG